jgi:drug/metabolite transporter (DMT)-like permease
MNPRLLALTAGAMIAFAANSLLCRVALREMKIDPASFTTLRLISGAVVLWTVVTLRRRGARDAGNWRSAFALFAYAATFSLAYVALPAGSGALLLFAAVQATMIICGLRRGERLDLRQWIGLLIAMIGLIVLLLPGIRTPPLGPSGLMLIAGIAWGAYSLRGKQSADAARDTAGNFVRAAPMAILVSLICLPWTRVTLSGAVYAVISGAVTSGLGYAIWYTALPHLKATVAATVQLSAPVLAAGGGILLLKEPLTLRMLASSVAVLGGIALVTLEQRRRSISRQPASASGLS